MALLNLMPIDTKISIHNHCIHIQDATYSQWFTRWRQGDTGLDIANLNTPLTKAIVWYIIDPSHLKDHPTLRESIVGIFISAMHGMKKLQITYKAQKSIVINLQYFINLIMDALEDQFSDDSLIPDEHASDNTLGERIRNNYDPKIIVTISGMLKDATKKDASTETTNSLIKCISELLGNMDLNFKKMMHEVNTQL